MKTTPTAAIPILLTALATAVSPAAAAYCGVVTAKVSGQTLCEYDHYPAMDPACTDIGGTVGGHLQENDGPDSNCVTYCNNVATGGHDVKDVPIAALDGVSYHLYVVDSCDSCGYCGGQ